jgi:undecaprenyl pyrophosphate phosphatase UppP
VSYLQAIVIGLFQGVTELFAISSLGHSVRVAAYFAVRFLVRFFETRNFMPFAIYCLVGGRSIPRFT